VVTSDGTVQTKAIGTATITAAATSDPTKTATATVTVETGKPDIPAPKVELTLTAPASTSVIEFIGDIQQVAGPVSGVQALKFPKEAYAKVIHGIAANGGGAKVNVYTLLIDFFVPSLDGYNCFYTTVGLDRNVDDGTVFLKLADASNPLQGYGEGWGVLGSGSGGYSNLVGHHTEISSYCPLLAPGVTDMVGEAGSVKVGTWYRLVMSHDLSTGMRCNDDAATYIKRYLNGLQIHASGYEKDAKFSMVPEGVLIHADNYDNGDCAEMSIANIAIWDVQLTDGQVEALGKAGEPMSW
jgi:hypothetical protein